MAKTKAKAKAKNSKMLDYLADKVGCISVFEVASQLHQPGSKAHDDLMDELAVLTPGAEDPKHRNTARVNKRIVSVDKLRDHFS